MNIDTVVLQVGQRTFTLLELLLAAAAVMLVLMLLAVVFAFRAQRGRRAEALEALRRAGDLEYRLAEMAGSLRSFADQTQGQQAMMTHTLNERLDLVSQRVGHGLTDQAERTAQSLSKLHERLAVIDTAQRNLTALSTEMVSLKDILSNKQTRGAFGQGRMEAIIRDGLHATAYSFQPTLSNGTRPDCLINLPESALRLVIDAKFPLESFNALKGCTSEAEAAAAAQRLRGDVMKHVKDISEKYLISGETHETAIMFVPSESIYAELHEKFEDVIQKSHRARVIIASPNVLLLLVQTMQAVFKDVAMREQAHAIKLEVGRLLEDVTRLKDRVGDLRKHFDAANTDIEKLGISAERISRRGAKIESLDLEEVPAVEAAKKPRLVGRGD
jgi:DNA recombination protein RmuC